MVTLTRHCWWWILGCELLCATSCIIDPGARSLPPVGRIPDPVVFGAQIHPLLITQCAAQACHGGHNTFLLHQAEPISPQAEFTTGLDLPGVLADDYFTVLALCSLAQPPQSHLLKWGTGKPSTHPGQAAMSTELQELIISWLQGPSS